MISNENVVKEQNLSNENVEILNIFKNIINNYSSNSIFDFEDYEITCVQVKSLLDYITNLQEENKNLKNEQISKYQTLKELQEENEKLEDIIKKDRLFTECRIRDYIDYKARIDKAIEFIKEKYIEDYSNNDNYIPLEKLNLKNCDYERSLQVLEILKGSDKK